MPLKTPNGDFTKPLNKVYIADNLPALRTLNESRLSPKTEFAGVDLIYLDPPFNSKANYNFVYGMEGATKGLTTAFTDTWTYDPKRFNNKVLNDPDTSEKVKKFLRHWREAFGTSGRYGEELAYLGHMVPRLEAMHAVLKPTGSLYLHCDQSASHALKKALDLIFGMENFRNDVIWCYTSPANVGKGFPRKHDNLLFYSKTKGQNVFNKDAVRVPHQRQTLSSGATGMAGGNRSFEEIRAKEAESLERGKVPEDWWVGIGAGSHMPKDERVGYPTQKPMALLKRVIVASTKPGDVVLDPYCGCGSTIEACLDLTKEGGNPRHFIGMELEGAATAVMRSRMRKRQGRDLELAYPKPKSLSDFDQLAANGAYAYYEHYAVGLIPGCRAATKGVKEELGLPVKGPGDKGMDGLLPVVHKGKHKVIVISVKAGNKIPPHSVRDLSGVLHNRANKAIKGYLVTRKGEITPNMREEAINAGFGNGLDKIRHISTYELWKMHRESLKRRSDKRNPKEALAQDRKAWAEFLDISEKLLDGLEDFNYTPADWKMREHFPV